jgi:Methyltransferase domain
MASLFLLMTFLVRSDSFALSRLYRVVKLFLIVCILVDGTTAFCLLPKLHELLGVGTVRPKSKCIQPRPRMTARAQLLFPSLTDDPSLADFSSPYFWEGFYKQQLAAGINQSTIELGTSQNYTNNKPAFVFDWHESIPLQDLANLIPAHSRCLMVGCGNSRLPQLVLNRQDHVHITLLDNSPTCVEQLKALYHKQDQQVECVCASATDMASYFQQQDSSTTMFDMIVDKGLTDAFMCGDAWERPVEDLLRESTHLLNTNEHNGGGIYLLVSYKMSPNVQCVFQRLTEKVGGDSVQWCWDFDIQSLSNHRVSVSMARVRSTQPR